jgi:adenylylsulfate kinase
MTVWLTGLPCAGKTTLGLAVVERLRALGRQTEFLDGDVLRQALWKDLGFTKADREENIHRIGFIAELLARNGIVVVVSAVSPYRAAREEVRRRCGGFVEVYVNAPLSVCEGRDVKGMYGRARRGELAAFTGVSDPYEPPLAAEVECHTDTETVEESADKVLRAIADQFPTTK